MCVFACLGMCVFGYGDFLCEKVGGKEGGLKKLLTKNLLETGFSLVETVTKKETRWVSVFYVKFVGK